MTLNLMTLGGLALGIGMMVDNAIVVLENIYRYLVEKNSAVKKDIEIILDRVLNTPSYDDVTIEQTAEVIMSEYENVFKDFRRSEESLKTVQKGITGFKKKRKKLTVQILHKLFLKVNAREEKLELRESAVKGTSEVMLAVLASTMTTMAVFLPIAFVPGIVGQIFFSMSLAIVF
ncbi:efflux RND transporter permease subunit, partial [bacterium]|nr:efflux RND transporter permease subunit [bacterium]